jgi:hypothetical protein
MGLCNSWQAIVSITLHRLSLRCYQGQGQDHFPGPPPCHRQCPSCQSEILVEAVTPCCRNGSLSNYPRDFIIALHGLIRLFKLGVHCSFIHEICWKVPQKPLMVPNLRNGYPLLPSGEFMGTQFRKLIIFHYFSSQALIRLGKAR